MRNSFVSLVALFFIFVPSLYPFTGTNEANAAVIAHSATATTLPSSTFASFNDSFTQCLGTDGNYYWGKLFQTFGSYAFPPCQSQMFSDFDFLSQHHIQAIRLWPVLSTFAYHNSTKKWSSNFNNNIANLDAVLAKLAQDNIKAYLSLMAVPDCGDPPEITTDLGYYFNPSLINNQTMQDQFISALQAFLVRYKNNPAIYGYDLVNEVSNVLANPPTKSSKGYCNLPYDTSDFTKTQALLSRMYTTAKNVDTVHSFTFSFDHLYAQTSQVFTMMSNDVDFYDFHAYSNNPKAFYQNFGNYDKPVIQGEMGVYGAQYDNHGNNCEGTGPDAYRNILPAMPPECQAIWLANAQAFVLQAKLHHIQAIFFQMWPSLKQYGVRLYNKDNGFTGYQLTTAGAYIFSLT